VGSADVARLTAQDRAGTSATYKRIRNLEYKIPSFVSLEAGDLIRKVGMTELWQGAADVQLLQYKPEDRLPLPGVLKHPWIKKYEKRRSKSGAAARES
jgi:aurora kinase